MGANLPSSSRHGRRRAPMSEINVTPLVDVMLVLLIIFMVTAPLLVAGVPIDLPESRAGALDQQAEPVQVAIDRDGAITIDDAPVAEAALPANAGRHRRPARTRRGPPHLPPRRPQPRLWPGDAGDGRIEPRRPQPRCAGFRGAGAAAMRMDRAEWTGTGAALLFHVALIGALSMSLAQVDQRPEPPSMEVEFVEDVGADRRGAADRSPSRRRRARRPRSARPSRSKPAPVVQPTPDADASQPAPGQACPAHAGQARAARVADRRRFPEGHRGQRRRRAAPRPSRRRRPSAPPPGPASARRSSARSSPAPTASPISAKAPTRFA